MHCPCSIRDLRHRGRMARPPSRRGAATTLHRESASFDMLLTQGGSVFRHPARVMKTKSMILLTTALYGFAFAPATMAQPAGDADPKATPVTPERAGHSADEHPAESGGPRARREAGGNEEAARAGEGGAAADGTLGRERADAAQEDRTRSREPGDHRDRARRGVSLRGVRNGDKNAALP